ncbi:SDR family oxidoreductase [Streptomyces sp. P9(2023)]|uniref:SDR family oxidoreductase n=1 Tax=Streptomyces sp. P9(2023) TaxID=3064394 RepID=UPI0028F43007|nr:SDR family oxidoreductase [Streptomyces sp. P9(2023)]MDT9692962.1 SDR family oxidoreductase [Streptomyces sp. P9(2023)]
MSSAPTVLLTGASGVIGTALLAELSDCHVIALIHRTTVPGADELLVGDLTAPLLGLDPAVYSDVVRRVDAVVHCAAVTDFSSGPEATHALNEAGTRQIVRLVADADAVLYHVSTALAEPARGKIHGLSQILQPHRAAQQGLRTADGAAYCWVTCAHRARPASQCAKCLLADSILPGRLGRLPSRPRCGGPRAEAISLLARETVLKGPRSPSGSQ